MQAMSFAQIMEVPMALVGDISQTVTAVAAVTALAGGYVQFDLKHSLLPCKEFDVRFKTLHRGWSQSIGEISYMIKNAVKVP